VQSYLTSTIRVLANEEESIYGHLATASKCPLIAHCRHLNV